VSWSELSPSGPIVVAAGTSVAVVASVKTSLTKDDLEAFAAKKGLVISDYAEEGQRAGLGPDPRAPDYRYVAAIALASRDVSLPWEVPWPASMFNDSQIVSAWVGEASNVPPPTPPAPETPRPTAAGTVWPTLFVGAVLLALIAEHASRVRYARARR
jgi:hypothetical protein